MNDSGDLPFMPFAKPSIGDDEIAEITQVLQSGWLTTGPRTAWGEADLAAYVGRKSVLCLSSATAGLHLAFAALDLKPGDEVITTPLTFVASLNTIVLAGGVPVLVDVDPSTLNMNAELLADAIGPRTRAIMPVHFAGLPVDLDPVYALAERHGLRVIEDCAHAIGAEHRGLKLGSHGNMCVFSLQAIKHLTTGDGGIITLPSKALYDRCKLLRWYGIDRDKRNYQGKDFRLESDVTEYGFKMHMNDLSATLGLANLPHLDRILAGTVKPPIPWKLMGESDAQARQAAMEAENIVKNAAWREALLADSYRQMRHSVADTTGPE